MPPLAGLLPVCVCLFCVLFQLTKLLFLFYNVLQMLESERMQVKDLKSRGFSDRQLQEMGYSEPSLHTPSVALAKQ